MGEKHLVQFLAPKDFLKQFDDAWDKAHFANRSQTLNFLMRLFVVDPALFGKKLLTKKQSAQTT